MKMLGKILLVSVIVVGLYFLGVREQGQKEEQKVREAVITGAAADWFGWMADGEISKALDVCGYPFDANGVEKAATREELEKILPRYLDWTPGYWPWTRPSVYVMSKFWHKAVDPNPHEKQTLAKSTRVVSVWMEKRDYDVRVYVRPDAEPKVIGFKVSGLEKRQEQSDEVSPVTQ